MTYVVALTSHKGNMILTSFSTEEMARRAVRNALAGNVVDGSIWAGARYVGLLTHAGYVGPLTPRSEDTRAFNAVQR